MERASRNSSLGIFNAIVGRPQFVMKGGSVMSQLLELEDAFREYERTTTGKHCNKNCVLRLCSGAERVS